MELTSNLGLKLPCPVSFAIASGSGLKMWCLRVLNTGFWARRAPSQTAAVKKPLSPATQNSRYVPRVRRV